MTQVDNAKSLIIPRLDGSFKARVKRKEHASSLVIIRLANSRGKFILLDIQTTSASFNPLHCVNSLNMSSFDIVQDSVRTQGRDTMVPKTTKFLDIESLQKDPNAPSQPKYELWTEEHSAYSKSRRENRENRVKPTPVADVPDFDMEEHLKELEAEKAREKSKWRLW